ncbi:MAG TPA: hypothetical protein VEA40_09935 [Ramlibacter sp.]|nr:hypothetical protein [Ramlibacter sp.]
MPDTPRSQPAAQPDVLGGEARNTGGLEGLSQEVGADGTPREQKPRDGGQADDGGQAEGEARPGKDENQAGFLKDR